VRAVAGVLIGFGAGWLVGDAQQAPSAAPSRPAAEQRQQAERAAGDAQRCSRDALVDAIRRQAGGC
jgi:hypothetical protein